MSEQNKASTAALTELNAAAVAAIQFALKADEGMVWLQCWNEGDFKACREEWPEAPDECYIGADPMLAAPPADRQGVALSVQCKTCGGTGDVIDMNGVWCGYCWCGARSKTKQVAPAPADRQTWASDGGYRCLNCGQVLTAHEGQRYCPADRQGVALSGKDSGDE